MRKKNTDRQVFVPAKSKTEVGVNVLKMLGKRAFTKGDVGIEVEVEGNKFPKRRSDYTEGYKASIIPKIWKSTHDGSLRGEDNCEYITDGPVPFDKVEEHIQSLWKMFDKCGTVLSPSNRTSVHIHLNAQHMYLNQICSFIAVFLSVEEVLTRWCGEHRVGNLFCLNGRDAPGQVTRIKEFLRTGSMSSFSQGLHYSNLNVLALSKFGSLEVRSLATPNDPQRIIDWVTILKRIQDFAMSVEDPRDIVEGFSGGGVDEYLEKIFGDVLPIVIEGSGLNRSQINESVYTGIQIAQDITYCRNWSLYQGIDIKKDPFGRSDKQALAAVSPMASESPAGPQTSYDAPTSSWDIPADPAAAPDQFNTASLTTLDWVSVSEPDWD